MTTSPPGSSLDADEDRGDRGLAEEGTPHLAGTNLERAGDYNQRVVLQAIRLNGPVTRVELARTTGLTAPAIANITRRLIQLGLVSEAGKLRGGRGQPATRLVIHPDASFSLGVNLDRDHMVVVILDLLGRVRARQSYEGPLGSPAAALASIRTMLQRLLEDADIVGSQLVGLGVALPDALASLTLPNQTSHQDWAGIDVGPFIAEGVADLTGAALTAYTENDAAAAARGELQFGLGRRYASFFYLLVSAGLGGGLVVEGEYFRGANGRSGEIGFLPIHSHRTTARSLQEAVSLSALAVHLSTYGVEISGPSDLEGLTGEAAQRVGEWLELAVDLLTEPLLTVSWLVNPAAILIGGRLPAALMDQLAERLTQSLQRRAPGAPVLAPVRRAAMAEDASAIGAAILPFLAKLLPSRASLLKTSD